MLHGIAASPSSFGMNAPRCQEELERAFKRDADCDGEPVADDLPQDEKDVRLHGPIQISRTLLIVFTPHI
jgi:hypothetical protein